MADYGAQIGSGGLIACPSSDAYNFGLGDFTVTALVQTAAAGGVVSRKGEQGPGWLVWIQRGGVIAFTTDNGVGYYEAVTDPTEICDGFWHQIATVRESGQLTIYLDGVQVQSGVNMTQPTPVDVTNSLRLLIGNTDQGMNRQFVGIVEDVTIWNRALTAAELIPTRYNQLTGQEPGLVGFWPMNGNLNDSSRTQNSGAASGPVSFVQIFHCDSAYGDNDYAFVAIANAAGDAAARASDSTTSVVTRRQEMDVRAGTPALIGALITALDDFTFPQGATLTVTDPNGLAYTKAQNDDKAYVEMHGTSVRLISVPNPLPGNWLIDTSAPGDLSFQLLLQTVPSSAIPDTVEAVLEPIYGSSIGVGGLARSAVSTWGWVGMAAATIGLGLLTIATAGATTPALIATLAAVAVADTAIVVAAAAQIPVNQPAGVFVDAGANMAEFGVAQNVVILADANSDPVTAKLYENRVEFYGYLSTKSFERVRLKGQEFTAAKVNAALQQTGVRYFTASAHGQPSYIVGGDRSDVLKVGAYPALAANGKIFHLLACWSGATLGLDLVRNGATAFFGYTKPFQLLTAKRDAFLFCDARVDYQLAGGATAGQAQDAAVAQFQKEIQEFTNKGDHNAAVILQANLDAFVGPRNAGYGNVNALIV